jgi:Tfp pilus assembly protein PilO
MRIAIEKRTLMTIGAFAFFIVAILGIVIYPSVWQIMGVEKDVASLRSFMERRYQKVLALRTGTEQVREIKEDVAKFPAHLFGRNDALKLITDLETLATARGIGEKIDHSNLDNISGNRVELGITVNGDYRQVLGYVADVERLPYFLTITSVRFAPLVDRQSDVATNATLSLELILYVN